MSVKNVYLTAEVAQQLELNQAYLLRVAKELREKNELTEDQMREAGKRNYIFSDDAVKKLAEHFGIDLP